MTSAQLRASVFLLLHVHLAIALNAWPRLGAVHAFATVLYGLRAAVRGDAARVVHALGYIAGAEVLWRMTQAAPSWEFAKYASIVIAGTALIADRLRARSRGGAVTWPWEPAAYFLLLAPAVIPTVAQGDWIRARQDIGFNLAGPLALAALSTYLWRRPVGRLDLSCLLLAITAPVVGILYLAAAATLALAPTFINDSNWVTSGGFGPNQVSAMLGFGVLAALVFATVTPMRALHGGVLVMMVAFAVQALLTFSRGGLAGVVISGLGLGAHLRASRGPRTRWLVYGSVCLLSLLVLLPWLQSFTKGELTARYTNPSTSRRLQIAQQELRAFAEHPLLGTGVGLGRSHRQGLAPHTEPTRMLAEHGILGMVALGLLVEMLVRAYRAQPPGLARGLTTTFALWASVAMLLNATRLVANPLAFAVSLVAWRVDAESDG